MPINHYALFSIIYLKPNYYLTYYGYGSLTRTYHNIQSVFFNDKPYYKIAKTISDNKISLINHDQMKSAFDEFIKKPSPNNKNIVSSDILKIHNPNLKNYIKYNSINITKYIKQYSLYSIELKIIVDLPDLDLFDIQINLDPLKEILYKRPPCFFIETIDDYKPIKNIKPNHQLVYTQLSNYDKPNPYYSSIVDPILLKTNSIHPSSLI